MTYPTKNVLLGHQRFNIAGIHADDPYFKEVCDNHDLHLSSILAGLVQDDYVCIDIGANIGLKSVTLAQYAPHGRVIAVEAAPGVCDVLEHNIRGSGLQNITVVRAAVGNFDGNTHIIENSAYGYIHPNGKEVLMKKLSTIYHEQGLARLDFVKIDVEGYEYTILKDCHELINTEGASVLLEFNAYCLMSFANVNPREFIEWLFQHFNYVMRIDRQKSGVDALQRLEPSMIGEFLHHNLVDDHNLTDLLVTNNSERLKPSVRLLTERLSAAVLDFAAATAERDRLAVEIAEMMAEREKLARQFVELTGDRNSLAEAHTKSSEERDKLGRELFEVSEQRDRLQAQLNAVHNSPYWKIGARLGAIRK